MRHSRLLHFNSCVRASCTRSRPGDQKDSIRQLQHMLNVAQISQSKITSVEASVPVLVRRAANRQRVDANMMEQASELLSQVNSLFEEREKQLQEGQRDLAEKVAAVEQEKQLMAAVGIADNDVLTLTVGGTIFSTKRSTLTQATGSSLAARFNGNWEQCLDRDENGRIFLDFDPAPFQHILSFLRLCATQSDPNTRPLLPTIEPSQQAAYLGLVNHLVLGEHMGHIDSTVFRFSSASSDFLLASEQNRATAVGTGSKYRSITLEPAIQGTGIVKIKINKKKHWMFVGVRAKNVDSTPPSCSLPSCHGWSCKNQQYCKGQDYSSSASSKVSMVHGNIVLVKADFPSKKLLFRNLSDTNVAEICLDVPAEEQNKFVFQVIMHNNYDEVELLPVTAEDCKML